MHVGKQALDSEITGNPTNSKAKTLKKRYTGENKFNIIKQIEKEDRENINVKTNVENEDSTQPSKSNKQNIKKKSDTGQTGREKFNSKSNVEVKKKVHKKVSSKYCSTGYLISEEKSQEKSTEKINEKNIPLKKNKKEKIIESRERLNKLLEYFIEYQKANRTATTGSPIKNVKIEENIIFRADRPKNDETLSNNSQKNVENLISQETKQKEFNEKSIDPDEIKEKRMSRVRPKHKLKTKESIKIEEREKSPTGQQEIITIDDQLIGNKNDDISNKINEISESNKMNEKNNFIKKFISSKSGKKIRTIYTRKTEIENFPKNEEETSMEPLVNDLSQRNSTSNVPEEKLITKVLPLQFKTIQEFQRFMNESQTEQQSSTTNFMDLAFGGYKIKKRRTKKVKKIKGKRLSKLSLVKQEKQECEIQCDPQKKEEENGTKDDNIKKNKIDNIVVEHLYTSKENSYQNRSNKDVSISGKSIKKPEYIKSKLNDTFGGENAKSLLYDENNKIEKIKMASGTSQDKKKQMNEIDCSKYLKSRRYGSCNFDDGDNAKSLMYGNFDKKEAIRNVEVKIRNENNENSVCNNESLSIDRNNSVEKKRKNDLKVETTDALNTNRSTILGGENVKNLMYNSQPSVPPPTRTNNKKNIQINDKTVKDTNTLQANRIACLGGGNMKSIFSQPLISKNNETKKRQTLGTSIANQSEATSSFNREEDNESRKIKNINSQSKISEKDEKIIDSPNNIPHNNQRSKEFAANRTACLGGDSMKEIMFRPPISKKKMKTVNELPVKNQMNATEKDDKNKLDDYHHHIDETRNLENENSEKINTSGKFSNNMSRSNEFRANRVACLGGSSMKNILNVEVDQGNNKSTLYFTNRSGAEKSIKNNTQESKCYEKNKPPSSGRATKISNISKEDKGKYSTLRANRKACLGGQNVKNLLSWGMPVKPTKKGNDGSILNTKKKNELNKVNLNTNNNEANKLEKKVIDNKIQNNKTDRCCEKDVPQKQVKNYDNPNQKAFNSNRQKNIGGDNIKKLIYGKQIPKKNNPVKKNSIRYSPKPEKTLKSTSQEIEVSGNEYKYGVHNENRVSGIGGDTMKNLIYGRDTEEIQELYSAKTNKQKNLNEIKYESTNLKDELENSQDDYKELRANRFACIGGQNMKNIIYGSD